MKIIVGFPPNIEKIRAKVSPNEKTIFTYGDTLYNPGNHSPIPAELMAHEETHTIQQGNDPEGWWDKYLEDVHFRLEQEVEAYQAQYKKFRKLTTNKKLRSQLADRLAKDLSGATYGNIIDYYTARQRIKT